MDAQAETETWEESARPVLSESETGAVSAVTLMMQQFFRGHSEQWSGVLKSLIEDLFPVCLGGADFSDTMERFALHREVRKLFREIRRGRRLAHVDTSSFAIDTGFQAQIRI